MQRKYNLHEVKQSTIYGGLVKPPRANFFKKIFWWLTPPNHLICRALVKTHLSSGQNPQGTINKLEVCFYRKPSLGLMTLIIYL